MCLRVIILLSVYTYIQQDERPSVSCELQNRSPTPRLTQVQEAISELAVLDDVSAYAQYKEQLVQHKKGAAAGFCT